MEPGWHDRYSDQQGQAQFLYSKDSRLGLGSVPPPIQCAVAVYPEVKRRGREGGHSSPTPRFGVGGTIPPLPIQFHSVHRDSLTLDPVTMAVDHQAR
jgi:hypothetical protein